MIPSKDPTDENPGTNNGKSDQNQTQRILGCIKKAFWKLEYLRR